MEMTWMQAKQLEREHPKNSPFWDSPKGQYALEVIADADERFEPVEEPFNFNLVR